MPPYSDGRAPRNGPVPPTTTPPPPSTPAKLTVHQTRPEHRTVLFSESHGWEEEFWSAVPFEMPAPRDTLWDLEAHSRGKHHILQRYIRAWLPIMTSRNRRVVIVDAFAGPGRYTGGEPGSPLILLDAYLNHRHQPQMQSEIVYLFIEERQDRVGHLQKEIDCLDLPENVTVEVTHGRYEDIFRQRLDQICAMGQQLAPTFAFVDPFGYSDAPMDLTGTFLQFEAVGSSRPRCRPR